MSDRRIPISLKVPEDDFYYEFVEPRRASKELSPFIYQILRAYYEDDKVKEAVKPHLQIPGEDKVAFFSRELERIAMEHSATVMDTMALQDRIEADKNAILDEVQQVYGSGTSEEVNTKEEKREAPLMIGTSTQQTGIKDTEKTSGSSVPQSTPSENKSDDVEELRREVTTIKSDFAKLSDSVNSNMEAILRALNIAPVNQVTTQPEPVTQSPIQTVNTEEQLAASQPQAVQNNVTHDSEVQVPQVMQPEPVASAVAENTGNTTVTDTVPQVNQGIAPATSENNAEKRQGKPAEAAFGRLLGSLSNKG